MGKEKWERKRNGKEREEERRGEKSDENPTSRSQEKRDYSTDLTPSKTAPLDSLKRLSVGS